jgi:hypothetical protein
MIIDKILKKNAIAGFCVKDKRLSSVYLIRSTIELLAQ